jgi:NADPH:quinone reductase-like Zn-dependent oxidoreductase
MQAARWERYGPPEVVTVRDVDRPVPGRDEVLIRVHAASVNRADLDNLYPRPSFSRIFLGPRGPRNHRLGSDVAGVVEAVGPDVDRFRAGDRVFADLYPFGAGAFAEYASAREAAFLRIPDGLSFEVAATLPHSAVLAIQGLRRRNGVTVKAGDKVLIDGASGNVGPFAVQIAKAFGAEVTGICSTAKVELVRSLGADHVIDYRTTDYTTTGERYDWILDTDSHQSIFDNRRMLRPRGVYVTLGGSGPRLLQALIAGPAIRLADRKRMGLMLWWKPFRAEDVATITGMIAAGTVRPIIDRTFALGDLVAALRHVDDGHANGKVLVIP